MKLSNKDLGKHIIAMLQTRLELNLKFGCLDDVEVQFTRAELTAITNRSRIEDSTVSSMITEIRDAGFQVSGAGRSDFFLITANVRRRMTRVTSLQALEDDNAFFEELAVRYEPVNDAE